MNACSDVQCRLCTEPVLRHHQRRRHKAFVYSKISILCILDVPLVRNGVATEYELYSLPFQNVADRAVDGVDCRYRPYDNPVFLIHNFIDLAVVEFSHLDGAATGGDDPESPRIIPAKSILQFFDEMFGPQLRFRSAGSPNIERPV